MPRIHPNWKTVCSEEEKGGGWREEEGKGKRDGKRKRSGDGKGGERRRGVNYIVIQY